MEAEEYLEYKIDNDHGGTELGDTLWDNRSLLAEMLDQYAKDHYTPTPQVLRAIPTEEEVLKRGDDILTELVKTENHITTQLNENENISYNTGFHSGFVLGYKEWAISESQEQTEGWISVEDRLPEDEIKHCLLYDGEVIYWGFYDSGAFSAKGVTHWQPLPNPPIG